MKKINDNHRSRIAILTLIFTGVFLLTQSMKSFDNISITTSRSSIEYMEKKIMEKHEKDYEDLREKYMDLKEDLANYQKFTLTQTQSIQKRIHDAELLLNELKGELDDE